MSVKKRRRIFEIVTMAWALTLVVLGAVHLTASPADANPEWMDCGDACGVYCITEGSECDSVYETRGCGCRVYCVDGSSAPIVCV